MDLNELYDLHERGELSSGDTRWNNVQTLLRRFVVYEVRRRSKGLYGEPLESAIDDVEGSVLRKFIAKKFSPRNGRPLEPILRTTTRNDLLSVFRRSKSPSTVGFEGDECTWEDTTKAVSQDRLDLFSRIRASMVPEFRFNEHPYIREALLAYFLEQQRYPGSSYILTLGVGVANRRSVYNAAVVDLNCAMMGVCDAN